jgi:hypothetical protein
MLDLVDKAFDQVSFTIQMSIIFTLHEAILSRRNHGLNAFGCDRCDQLICVIAFIGNQRLRLKVFKRIRRDFSLMPGSLGRHFFLRPCRTWMRANNGRVNEQVLQVGVARKCLVEMLENALLSPARTKVTGRFRA